MRFNVAITLTIIAASASMLCAEGIMNTNEIWIDMYEGRQVEFSSMAEDIATADVIYLGEMHTCQKHHDLQLQILKTLSKTDRKIVLALEQLGNFQQDIIEKYNADEISLDELVETIEWKSQWSNYEDYLEIVKFVKSKNGRILGLNAREKTIRGIARKGLNSLNDEKKSQLPDDINFDKSQYKEYLSKVMMVMPHVKNDPAFLERMFTAQMCRDETMAQSLFDYYQNYSNGWIYVVVCGKGHIRNGAGMPECVNRRLEGLDERIIVFGDDPDCKSQPQPMARPVNLTHQDMKFFTTPIADYINISIFPEKD
jgi:uncharacterized iron-regulated protein